VPALAKAPDYFSNQPDFYTEAAKIAATATGFTWGPDVTVTYGKYNDAFAAAIQSKSSFANAVNQMQATTLADMKKTGFTIAG
jgi:multiple sugar transport system substrate-binding protein